MVDELQTFEATTNGTAAGGTFSLDSDVVQTPVTVIQIPPGMNLKIWAKRATGLTSVTVIYRYSITANLNTGYTEVSRDVLPAPTGGSAELVIEKKRPIILRGITGNEGVQVLWAGANTGGTVNSVEFDAIFGNEVFDDPEW